MDYINKIINGNCIDVMRELPDNAADMVLCDLPYGFTDCVWDKRISFELLWEQYNRVVKPNGAVVLFSAQKFTTELIESNIKYFRYCWYWVKPYATGFAFAKYQPMRKVEDICVFYRKTVMYNPQGLKELENAKPKRKKDCADSIYKIHTLTSEYIPRYTGYPKNVLCFASDVSSNKTRLHPTQKPVALCEYLIRTYTKEGDVVLDNCIGSGTTAVAAINSGRRFVGIELSEVYCRRAEERVKNMI